MKLHCLLAIALMLPLSVAAQTSGSSDLQPTPIFQNSVPLIYRISDEGQKLPDITWGLDQAWISEGNMRRGLNFAGQDLIDIVRLSFQPSQSMEEGTFSADQKRALDERIRIAKYAKHATINLNSDPQDGKAVDSWYRTNNATTNGKHWATLIALTKQYVESKGLKVTSVSPFNEPDYTNWNQGSQSDFRATCQQLRAREDMEGVLLCGGNTLNDDQALSWYNFSKAYLDEGNTHQLAGSFDNFAKFYQQVVKDGKVGVGDELHNTMECMVGSEYGLTKGIWWGTCDHTRSQFMKASRGRRLGYAEHRGNWTAASIYRHPEGHVQAFGGTSERQAVGTAYRLIATDHDVFYNGQGPTREYFLNLPGGNGYQKGQTNAETCVDIQDGEDIMPPLPTKPTAYKFVNRASGYVIAINGNTLASGSNMTQERPVNQGTISRSQQWIVRPIGERSGGDFSYYKIMNERDTTLLIDVLNWSLEDRGALIGFKGGVGDNEQWYFEYAGDGWFYIRSRHSALCIEVTPGTESQMKLARRALCQGVVDGNAHQQWRLLPVDVVYDNVAPAAPTALTATPLAAANHLTWQAPTDTDLNHYVVLRSTDQQTWNTIHNNVPSTEYFDNTADPGTTYYYRVLAVDHSQNRSESSNIVGAAATGAEALICHLPFNATLQDASGQGNHAAEYGTRQLTVGRLDSALVLNGSTNYVQLPATIANSRELTFCCWVYWRGGAAWQRLFDFGTDTDHYVFLTLSSGSTPRLAIKDGGAEQTLSLSSVGFGTNRWRHVAVTFGESAITVYFDGKQVARSATIKQRPADFRPVCNFLGRSQFPADPALKADLDDVRIYNYALTPEAIQQLITDADDVHAPGIIEPATISTPLFDLSGQRHTIPLRPGVYIRNNRKFTVK